MKVSEVPETIAKQNDEGLAGYLEVIDVVNQKMRFVPVPEYEVFVLNFYWSIKISSHGCPLTLSKFYRPKVSSSPSAYVYSSSENPILVAERGNSGLVTVDVGGCLRLWETGIVQLSRSLDEWQKMVGTGNISKANFNQILKTLVWCLISLENHDTFFLSQAVMICN